MDKMLTHIASHKECAVSVMNIAQREQILTLKKPIVYYSNKKGEFLYGVCLHCKKGSIFGAQRAKGILILSDPHTECIAEFHRYENMFMSKAEPRTLGGFTEWTKKSQEKKPRKSQATVVGSSTLPKTIEDDIVKMWKLYEVRRIDEEKQYAVENDVPYEPEDEPEPDLMGKLTTIFKDYNQKKKGYYSMIKTIAGKVDEISVLETDIELLRGQNHRMAERLQTMGSVG
jgi:hypothetical protein